MTIKRILHASDFSPASRPAFRLAQKLARAFKAKLILCHAWQRTVPIVGEGYVPPSLLHQMWTATRRSAGRKLERLATTAKQNGIRVSPLLVEGPAAWAIVRAAKGQRAELLVVGTHGRTGVRRMLLGSVAERVVRTAPCPVVSVGAARG